MSPDAQSRTEPPFTLPERYRLRRHVATGGMASVWCAEDRVLGRSVAIKVLAERFAHDQLAMLRFKREARAAARVSDHPHVVTVYDVGDLVPDDGSLAAGVETLRAFIVMEYLAGGTVADAIHHDSVRRHEAMRWLREAASALDHAHERGIVHRDVKPANFLLDGGRVLHVADFGIARLTSEDTITSADQLFGTAAYLSPEQALGREATSASDRYALAVAAFELLVGERPFTAEHFSAQARQHIEEPPPAASDRDRTLSPAVDDVLFTGLAKDPATRPETAGAFVGALADALSADPAARQHTRVAPRSRLGARMIDPAAPAASTAAARRWEPPSRASGTRAPTGRVPGPPQRERGRRRAVALGALAVAGLLVVGIALAATRLSGSHHAARVADRPATTATPRRATLHRAAPRRRRTATTASSTGSATITPTSATVAPSAAQLESTGHAEMTAGDYASAIPTLQKAVSASSPTSLNYAYALYDLGRSYVLSGDPSAAIPVLQKRLQIDNQTPVVRSLYDQALAAAGEGHAPASGGVAPTTTSTTSQPQGPTAPPGGHGPGAPGRSGGAGLAGSGGPGGAAGGPGHGSGQPGHGPGDHGNGNGNGNGHGQAGPGGNAQNQFRAVRHSQQPSIVQLITAAAG